MFKKILYPTDFSPHSNAVAECVINFIPAGAEEVVLLHVVDQRIFMQFPEMTADLLDAMKKSAEENITGLEKKMSDAGLKVSKIIETGIPFNAIVSTAKSEGVNLIVMGSHGRSLVEEMLLGSTTENVLRHATVPVLIEKFAISKDGKETVCSPMKNPFERILFPTDFSECSLSALPYIKQFKDAGLKEVVLLHVQDMAKLSPHLLDKLPEFEDIDTGRLEKIKQDLIAYGIDNVKVLLKEGIPFLETETIAKNENISLVILGSHGKSMIKEMMLGSVSGKIVRRCNKPLLIIRRK